MEYFFKRLEAYIKVRPTAAMSDIIVKIMVEVISILGIVTKEIRQGRTSMYSPIDISRKLDLSTERYFKKLFGRKDVEDALQRLDKLTQEEARMAAAESLTITRGIDDKAGFIVDGELYRISPPRIGPQPFRVGVKEIGVAVQRAVNQFTDLQSSWSSDLTVKVSLTSLIGHELRKDIRKWISPPDPSVNYNIASSAHHDGTASWCTKGITLADWKSSGSLLWIHGKRTYPMALQVLFVTD